MANDNFIEFRQMCTSIRQFSSEEQEWHWDPKLNLACHVFADEGSEVFYEHLMQTFKDQWDFYTIESAPEEIDNFVNFHFGIVPGQKVFTSHIVDGMILFAVWWPWGNGINVSLRIGLLATPCSTLSKDEIMDNLKSWLEL